MNCKYEETGVNRINNSEFESILIEVASSLKRAGYDPYEQISGYLKTGNALFITRAGNEREKIRILCADGLSGMKDTIASAFHQTEYQRCMVHQVRNTLKYVPDKDRKLFANDLKSIYRHQTRQKP